VGGAAVVVVEAADLRVRISGFGFEGRPCPADLEGGGGGSRRTSGGGEACRVRKGGSGWWAGGAAAGSRRSGLVTEAAGVVDRRGSRGRRR
jgi:hypothetical protein